jgi:hypothetical protein
MLDSFSVNRSERQLNWCTPLYDAQLTVMSTTSIFGGTWNVGLSPAPTAETWDDEDMILSDFTLPPDSRLFSASGFHYLSSAGAATHQCALHCPPCHATSSPVAAPAPSESRVAVLFADDPSADDDANDSKCRWRGLLMSEGVPNGTERPA